MFYFNYNRLSSNALLTEHLIDLINSIIKLSYIFTELGNWSNPAWVMDGFMCFVYIYFTLCRWRPRDRLILRPGDPVKCPST
jgi:hypothetical protein